MNTKLQSQILASVLVFASTLTSLQPAYASSQSGAMSVSTTFANTAVKTDSLWKIVKSLANAGKIQEAMNAVDQALQADPKNGTVQAMKAFVMYKSHAKSEAVLAQINLALSNTPDNVDAIYLRGLVYEDMNELQKAGRDFDTCIAMDNHNIDAVNESLKIKFAMKNWSGAVSLLNFYIANNKVDGTFYYARAFAEYRLGQISEAINDLKKAESLFIADNQQDDAKTTAEMIKKLEQA